MTDRQAKTLSVERLAPETKLIYMETPHSTDNPVIGVVPFIFTESERAGDPGYVWINSRRVLIFHGRRYVVNGWGPTDSVKQRAIIGPYPTP